MHTFHIPWRDKEKVTLYCITYQLKFVNILTGIYISLSGYYIIFLDIITNICEKIILPFKFSTCVVCIETFFLVILRIETFFFYMYTRCNIVIKHNALIYT